ncbi:hypothetical protein MsAm2_04460 [Methanolapillus ohkumae]|uniref:DUF3788 family protein n=2 Tax=Methanolapillus ohkumae TaxID=3028298 RepID=A0AA96ZVF6_9EURY|nr:hypothetical protein MsAm2_04460 [Methanosarcinaceae archaeon Am2]
MKAITDPEFHLTPEWHYYKDGKSWLCKVVHKKKTVFWLSVWDGFFKTTFYMTEKIRGGIENLSIDSKIKNDFKQSKPIGKLIPLTVRVDEKNLKDVLLIVDFKKKLK